MIDLCNIQCKFGASVAVEDVSLRVEAGELAAIVGTSGSGKTTLLKTVNRLIDPTSGTVKIDGEDNRDRPVHELRRGIGYAIQGNGLFPHRTVAQNIATVPDLLGWSKARIRERVDEMLAVFQLDPDEYRDRFPRELSGGQQQRVGVARALAANPAILLMDEPFGALDPIIRREAQNDLKAIQKHFGTTIMFVTHDMDEAIRMGSHVAVMDQGKLLQYSTPAELIAHPKTPFIQTLLGGTGDRIFRLLSIVPTHELVEDGDAEGNAVPGDNSIREALALLLWSGRDALPVSHEGNIIGKITRQAIETKLNMAI